jgi:hypothetical protein
MGKRELFVALGLLATAACTDLAGPPADGPHGISAALAVVDGRAGVSVGNHILEQAPAAPPLETYELSFWAVRGQDSYVEIRYQGDQVGGRGVDPAVDRQVGGDVSGEVFLSLYIPAKALSRYPDGTKIGKGERVLITISIDPVDLYVSLEPAGLVFNRRALPLLYLSYNGANPDYDGDGDVDEVDQYIEDNHLKLWCFHYSGGASAEPGMRAGAAGGKAPKASKSGKKNKSFIDELGKLSDHAVSW